ncbi:MAG: NAD(P)H-hydrate dehydratase [Nitrospinota bacterium]|nr:NAD(P)H-hydrate dehydratase [Nitrospinota bacterium]
MEILTAKEMREVDRKSIEDYGIPGPVLMENAGIQTVIALEDKFNSLTQKNVSVFAGKGNNGGDGAVVARHLFNKKVKVEIFLFAKKDDTSHDAKINLDLAQKMGIPIHEVESLDKLKTFKSHLAHAHIFIDALLGTGITPPVKGVLQSVISFLNDLNKFTLAIDIPSGLSSDHGNVEGKTFKADMTVTFCRPKRCHFLYPAADLVGELKVVDISIPDKIVRNEKIKVHTIDRNDIGFLFQERKRSSHKGTYGHLLVIGGSTGKGGAAAMAGLSALRIGTGLVTLAVPQSVNSSIEMNPIEVMSIPLPETQEGSIDIAAKDKLLESINGKSSVLIGPGLSTQQETIELLLMIIPEIKVPLLIDADGLNCLADHLEILKKVKVQVIITPHPGEMSRLARKTVKDVQADRIGIAQKFAVDYNVIVVLKGAGTIIALPDGSTFINTTGNPGMASAGTGDVLAGMAAGLLAQNITPADASKAAVYLHGFAGDRVSQKKSQVSLIASDLIEVIPSIFK